jgi:hypothetical protein
MGGIDKADYLRMARFSVQAALAKNKWYLSIYFGLYDMALTNAYVLWRMLHPERTDTLFHDHYSFLVAIVDGICALPDGEEERVLRSLSTATPAHKRRRSSFEMDTILFSPEQIRPVVSFPGHPLKPLVSGDEKVRRSRNRVDVDSNGYKVMYGYSGASKRFARCFVCTKNGRKNYTDHYCAHCQVNVCVQTRNADTPDESLCCWNLLHTESKYISKYNASCVPLDFAYV